MLRVIIAIALLMGAVLIVFLLTSKSNANADDKVILTATLRDDGEWKLYPEERAFLAIGIFRSLGESYVENVWLSEELLNGNDKMLIARRLCYLPAR